MRLHSLELSAFGPFAGKERIDFDALAEAGLFLLNGETGAGKTSILDAVCFALYGSLPGARDSMSKERVRSDHASDDPATYQPTYVECEFSVGSRRFRVNRSPAVKRPKRRGEGYTTEQAKTLLEEFRDGSWVALTNRNDEAGQQLTAVLGLQRDQFTKLVMLPQGEFAAFLRSNANEKDAILRQLFDTRTFARIEEVLWQRFAEARDAIGADEIRLGTDEKRLFEAAENALTAWRQTRIAAGFTDDPETVVALEDLTLELRAQQLEAAEAVAKAWSAASNTAYHDAEKVFEQRKEKLADAEAFEAWQRRRTQLTERESHVVKLRALLERDERARALRPAQEQRDQACHLYFAKRDTFNEALSKRHDSPLANAIYEKHEGYLDEIVDTLAERIAVLTERAKQEELLVAKTAQRKSTGTALETVRTKIAELTASYEASVAALPGLEEQLTVAQAGVLSVEAAQLKLTQAGEILDAATKLEAVRAEVAELALHWQTRSDATRSAQERERLLTETAHRQVAARLALILEDDQPCPVCGSAEHPAPAVLVEGQIVTDDEREEAAAQSESCRLAETAAEKVLRAAQDRETQLAAHARDLTLEDAATAVSTAKAAVKAAEGTVTAADAAAQHLKRAHETVSATEVELASSRVREESLARDVETLDQEVGVLTEEIVKDRGEYGSVSERVAAEKAARALLLAEMETEDEKDRAFKGVVEAAKLWGDRLFAAGFIDTLTKTSSEAKFVEALLEDPVREAHQAEVTSYADEQSRVAELEVSAPVTRHRTRVQEGEPAVTPAELESAGKLVESTLRTANIASKARILLTSQREGFDSGVARNAKDREALEPRRAVLRELEGLAKVARGEGDNRLRMRLSSFVLAAKLEAVASAATVRLHEMTDGRYQLIHVDDRQGRGKGGLDLAVSDAWTGQQRDTNSLSGGETFMVSLSLALGLAEVIQAEAGGISLETLFVDEGFGTLDQGSLEQVMNAIDDLREGGRVVGLVSHVEELKQRIPAQIQVHKTQRGSTTSVILGDAA
ncbi:exonuclease SbcC [Neomicrococcus aestuarii]|uniref:Nuclease SbcCD subunit C n=1 Tax=Neomicrococcus aestuarii TaxID=556325 RepID=A0A7W8TR85_9MICC|nr:SMC family ATPase [Neomicrococcus aestuarii]MBB5511319.1 exonuclease SbcC [Neomicrococcus aestuarii]